MSVVFDLVIHGVSVVAAGVQVGVRWPGKRQTRKEQVFWLGVIGVNGVLIGLKVSDFLERTYT